MEVAEYVLKCIDMVLDTIKYISMYITIPIVSALIGTYWGAKRINKYNENQRNIIRDIAKRAIGIFKKYAQKDKTYKMAEEEFNADFLISEKRAILVALHKLGIPISIPVSGEFTIKSVQFLDVNINIKELEDIEKQISNGYIDNLFFIDVEMYFNKDLKIRTLRSLAKKYVNIIMRHSNISDDGKCVDFNGKDWCEHFSPFEVNALLVFRMKTLDEKYYDNKHNIIQEKIDTLLKEIDNGLCDMYLETDINVYNNIIVQRNLAEFNMAQAQKLLAEQENTHVVSLGENISR